MTSRTLMRPWPPQGGRMAVRLDPPGWASPVSTQCCLPDCRGFGPGSFARMAECEEISVKIGDLLELDRRVETLEAELEGPKEDLKSAIESGCDALMIRKDAFKSARKLRKLKLGELREWLRTFDACREAFGFDSQIDIEDVLDNGEQLAGEVEVKAPRQGLRRKAAEPAELH